MAGSVGVVGGIFEISFSHTVCVDTAIVFTAKSGAPESLDDREPDTESCNNCRFCEDTQRGASRAKSRFRYLGDAISAA